MAELMTVKNRTYEYIRSKKLTVKEFETRCGLSNGYIAAMRKSFGDEKLNNVLTKFPDLNRDWLLYGEGDMVINDKNQDNELPKPHTTALEMAINEIDEQRKLVAKAQEQIDRLLTIIEKLK